MDTGRITERYGSIPDEYLSILLGTEKTIDVPTLLSMASEGSKALVETAKWMVSEAADRHGWDTPIGFPETGYSLPAIHAWTGASDITLESARDILYNMDEPGASELTDGFKAGENAMFAAEIVEAVSYLEHPEERDGFIPDRVLRGLGLSFVDETIPGAVAFLGGMDDAEALKKMSRDFQGKGMVGIASGDFPEQFAAAGVKMGLDRMFYPVGFFTGTVHALNFAVRAALTFGNVEPGDRDAISEYLKKRPKVIVIQSGPLNRLDAAFAFAALLHSASIVTDQDLPEIPHCVKVCKKPLEMIQNGIEERGITVKLEPIDLPVGYAPSFEGEVVRKPDTYVEAGGTRSPAFEILISRKEDEVEDGKVTLIGKEIDEMPEGSLTPLALIVEVYGQNMHDDLEPVMERRFHSSINFAEGVWHAGQRNTNWVRISKASKEAGFKIRDLGRILVHKIKEEFGAVVTRVQATVITDQAEMEKRLPEALKNYDARDERMKGLKDDSVDTFYTCAMCQSFAPGHICIISPERLGLCGAINWLDAKAGFELDKNGPNKPLVIGDPVDDVKGEWESINEAVRSESMGRIERMCMYSLMDCPMTSCGCFEVIVAMTVDMQAVVVVDRDFSGMTPVGMKFSSLAGSIGGGRQTPGFMGIGKKYLTSEKFMSAEGGIARIAWMPKHLKDAIAEDFRKRCEDIGLPDLMDKIADETVTEDAEGLMAWMAEQEHPALFMDPLL